MGIFHTRRVGKGAHLEDWLLKPGSQPDPQGSTFSQQAIMRPPGLEYHLQTRVGSLPAGVYAPQHCLHEEERAAKVLPNTASG